MASEDIFAKSVNEIAFFLTKMQLILPCRIQLFKILGEVFCVFVFFFSLSLKPLCATLFKREIFLIFFSLLSGGRKLWFLSVYLLRESFV